jgi:PAS domain S-box-containing protein
VNPRVNSVAVLAPTGRDGPVAARALEAAGLEPVVAPSMAKLCEAIRDGIGAVLLAEESLTGPAREELFATLDAQPSWSDVPVVVLTGDGELTGNMSPALVAVTTHANALLLERPVRMATLITTLRSALRARQRQFDVRDYLEQRIESERSVRESESRLRAMVLAAPYPMMLHADEGEVLQLSRAWSELSGFSVEELRSTREWTERAYGETADEVMAAIEASFDAAAVANGAAVPAGEWWIRTASGERRLWDFTVVALGRLPDRRRLNITAAVDVTDTRRLIESERRAREQAELANKAKSDFLATMSHELRTPLNAIAGYTQLIALGLRGPVTDDQLTDLRRIERSQRHLLSLINDVLNFAKIEAGHVQFDIEPIAMRMVLTELDALVAPQIAAKGLRYVNAAASCDAWALADAEKTGQVLLNLLSNAVKFTPSGGAIHVECASEAGVVVTRVRDTGAGIPRERLASIFEPFVQVERGLTSTQEGTGLGLSISRDLARRMGGELTVESRVGTGSVFTLSLPAASPPEEVTESSERLGTDETESAEAGGSPARQRC